MARLIKIRIMKGVYWIDIPEADLRILCASPEDVIKHLMRRGLIVDKEENEVIYETGPNAILLSDVMVQNGKLSNLAEFPVLQMLYRQGMILPNHPGNTGVKPLLIGSKEQVDCQLEYIYRGNYGLISEEEMIEAGLSAEQAKEYMRLKLKFAFGKIRATTELLDSLHVQEEAVEIKNGVTIRRMQLNLFEISYAGEKIVVDLTLLPDEDYESPFPLAYYNLKREYFAVIHSGQGDGWDINRPCMASIIMFQGKIYLIDTGPNISHILMSLGISINEIEGIFHTHSHDDHFAGLPTLIQSDHKIKYYATRLVRASVTKKLSTLLSIDESRFEDYFEICDLDFDEWNNIEGLEVMPVLSPHPVETNILYFRTLWEDGYRTYAHLADTSSFDVLEKMLTDDPEKIGISQNFLESVRQSYLIASDLKKIDIGGGLIHGKAEDFRDDSSKKIILAHTARELTNREKEIGSSAPFGVVDSIIPDYQDFIMRAAFHYFKSYFPNVQAYYIRILMNNQIETFNPGTILLKDKEYNESIYLILTGNVEVIQTVFGIHSVLSAGALVGELSGLHKSQCLSTYRATSFVQALRIPSGLFREFIRHNELEKEIEELQDKREFLQKTWLFGDAISYPVQNRIATGMELCEYIADSIVSDHSRKHLLVIRSGTLELHQKEKMQAVLGQGDFIGEDALLRKNIPLYSTRAAEDVSFYKISFELIRDIPVIHWKLFESFEKRRSFS